MIAVLGRVLLLAHAALGADLAVQIRGPAETVAAWRTVDYEVLVSNRGPSPATEVRLTNSLPKGLGLIEARPSRGECAPQVPLVCTFALPAGESATIRISVKGVLEGAFHYRVTVAAREPDPRLGNNTATTTTRIGGGANLAVRVIGAPAVVRVGQAVSFKVGVTNLGPSAATETRMSFAAAGTRTLSAVSTQGTCADARDCRLGTLPGGASAMITVVATPVAPGRAEYSAHAATQAPGGDGADHVASGMLEVRPSHDVAVSVEASPDPVRLGETVTYRIEIGNHDPVPAPAVTLSFPMSGVAFLSASPSQGACRAAVECDLGELPGGGKAMVIVVGRPIAEGTLGHSAAVGTVGDDPVPVDNQALGTVEVRP